MGLVALATGLISLLALAKPEPPVTPTDQTTAEIPAPVVRVLSELGVPLVMNSEGSS
jgi:hypothetical protein